MQLVGIEASHIEAVWPHVERHIARALDFGDGEYLPEDIKAACLAGEMKLWVGTPDGRTVTGAGATTFVRYPRKVYCDLVCWASDTPIEDYFDGLGVIEDGARSIGAIPRVFGRKGWARKLKNYAPRYTVFVRAA